MTSTAFEIIDESGARRASGYEGFATSHRELLQGNGICTSTVMTRRAILERAGPFDARLTHSEDWDLWIRIATLGRLVKLEEILARYRVHRANTSSDYLGYYRESCTMLRRHRHGVDGECVPLGLRRVRQLAGAQAMDAFRSTRQLRHLAWAVWLNPRHTRQAFAAKASHRLRRLGAANGDQSRPRVVYLCHTAILSGAELSVKDFLEAGPDVDPHLICAEPGPLVDQLLAAGVPAEVLRLGAETAQFRMTAAKPGVAAARGAARLVLYGVRLGLVLRRMRPDLVQANSLKSGIYGAIAARICGAPLVWSLHDRLSADQLPAIAAAFMRQAVKHGADVVICNSASTLDSLGPDRGRPRRYVVSPATNLDGALPHVPSSVLRVGIVGRITPWKGQDVFLRAFAESFMGTATSGAIIGGALFGSSDENYDGQLRDLVSQLGIADQITFRGHQPDIWRELSELDILVHASTVAEPFGRVIIEGMAAGVPVVAANAGGPREIITDGYDGLLFTPADPHALAACLAKLGSDPRLRAQLSANARSSAQRYSVESVVRATDRIYAETLDRPDPSPAPASLNGPQSG